MTKLSYVEGIGPAYEALLNEAGISDTKQYLEICSTVQGRKELAQKTGIAPNLILTWTNHLDLCRIKGVGGQFAELLEASGVDTVPELATRNAANLHAKMISMNAEKKRVRRVPGIHDVENWILEAKTLPRIVKY